MTDPNLRPHPHPSEFNMVAVTREQFNSWLMSRTFDVQSSSHHSHFLMGKIWSEYRHGSIGPIIGRTYCDYMGSPTNHMLVPHHAAVARTLPPYVPPISAPAYGVPDAR